MDKLYILNSFCDDIKGGNPAGLVLNQDMDEAQMLKIAHDLGMSETAFLKKIDDKTYSLRYFTPAGEVDLCGHATIATFSFLKQKGMVEKGEYSLKTKAGMVKIFIDDKVFMTQKLPVFSEILSDKEVLDCFYDLNIGSFAPIQVVSTGLRDIILPVCSLDNLFNLKPDFEKISNLSKKYNTIGIHCFTLETMYNSTAHCRNFAPLYEINEESATGTANGALSCYLYKYNLIEKTNGLKFEQGYYMEKPSMIYADLIVEDENIKEVRIGGNAILVEEKNK